MSENILDLIKSKAPHMSKGHRRIADYIAANLGKAAYLTAAKLGEETDVSESTVVRFAANLGFEGYPELGQALKEYTGSKLTSVERIGVMNEQIRADEVYDKILNMDIDKLKKTLENGSRESFYGAAENLCNAENIYVIGARSAAVLARYASFYLNMMSPSVKLIHTTSTSEMFEQILSIGPSDLIIGMSFPRYSSLTVKALRYAKDRGAKVIALTDSRTSPLAEYADNLLIAKNNLTSFADSLVAPMSVLNALIVAVGMKKQDFVKENLNRLEEIYDRYEVFENRK
jgi:DNA-binding MurR/RpiR family transcriptional regulator